VKITLLITKARYSKLWCFQTVKTGIEPNLEHTPLDFLVSYSGTVSLHINLLFRKENRFILRTWIIQSVKWWASSRDFLFAVMSGIHSASFSVVPPGDEAAGA